MRSRGDKGLQPQRQPWGQGSASKSEAADLKLLGSSQCHGHFTRKPLPWAPRHSRGCPLGAEMCPHVVLPRHGRPALPTARAARGRAVPPTPGPRPLSEGRALDLARVPGLHGGMSPPRTPLCPAGNVTRPGRCLHAVGALLPRHQPLGRRPRLAERPSQYHAAGVQVALVLLLNATCT